MQSVLHQIMGKDIRKASLHMMSSSHLRSSSTNLSQRLNSYSSTRNLRSSQRLRSSSIFFKSKPQEDDREDEHQFEVDGVPFTLFHPVCSSGTLASTSYQTRMQAHVGKVAMVLFVVPLTWFEEEIFVEEEGLKVNRMDFALLQFRTLCQMFANTDAGVAVILDDWAGLVEKLKRIPEARGNIGNHFLNYPSKDEGNPNAAAIYFAKLFLDMYNNQSKSNNCFICVARPDKRSSDCSDGTNNDSKNKKNGLSGFLLRSVQLVIVSSQLQSLLMVEDSESKTMNTGKHRNDNTRTHKDNKNAAASGLDDSITAFSMTEDFSCDT